MRGPDCGDCFPSSMHCSAILLVKVLFLIEFKTIRCLPQRPAEISISWNRASLNKYEIGPNDWYNKTRWTLRLTNRHEVTHCRFHVIAETQTPHLFMRLALKISDGHQLIDERCVVSEGCQKVYVQWRRSLTERPSSRTLSVGTRLYVTPLVMTNYWPLTSPSPLQRFLFLDLTF